MNKLKVLRRHGIAVQIKVTAHNQTWIDDIAAFSVIAIGTALAAFILIKRRRPLLH